MNLFKTFISIKTGVWLPTIKSLFIPNSAYSNRWEYIEYYYDRKRHSFYINDTSSKTKALKYIKQIVNKAYLKELCPLYRSSRDKRANIFCVSLDEKA